MSLVLNAKEIFKNVVMISLPVSLPLRCLLPIILALKKPAINKKIKI